MTDTPFHYPGFKPPSPPSPQRDPLDHLGLAVASLSLGIVGAATSVMVTGLVFGLIGLILGIIAVQGGSKVKSMAGWGIGLSAVAILSGVVFGLMYFAGFQQAQKQMQFGMETDWNAWIGEPSPDLAVTDLEGNSIQLSQYKGKRIVLDFFATWCPPCVEEIPHFIELRNTVSNDELIILGISNEPPDELKPFVAEHKINYPVISADELPEPFNVITAYPTTFFIDRNGIIQNVLEGYNDLNELKKNAVTEDYVAPTKYETDDTTIPETPANEQ